MESSVNTAKNAKVLKRLYMESEPRAFENDWPSALTGLEVKNPWGGEGGT